MSPFVSWRGEELEELERLALADQRQELVHALLDGLALGLDLVREQRLPPVEQLLEGADEVEEAGLEHLLAARRRTAAARVGPRPGGGADLGLLVQDARGLLVALELEQALHQLLARVLDSSSPCASVGSTGTSIFDLMWMSVAAITMNSPATSRFSSCISSRYSMYWRVMGAIGMSWMSILSRRIRYSSRSSGPSNSGSVDPRARPPAASTRRPRARPRGRARRAARRGSRRAAPSPPASGGRRARVVGLRAVVAHAVG